MEKITFKNGQTPAINGTNLNQLQTNIENAIKELYDIFHPIGSYYETSDVNFNPNTAWGGTWELDSKGRVTVSQDEEQEEFATVGKTGGSKEMQEHTHTAGSYDNFAIEHTSIGPGSGLTGLVIGFKGTSTHIKTNAAGTGDGGNLQPYIVVLRWHRVA